MNPSPPNRLLALSKGSFNRRESPSSKALPKSGRLISQAHRFLHSQSMTQGGLAPEHKRLASLVPSVQSLTGTGASETKGDSNSQFASQKYANSFHRQLGRTPPQKFNTLSKAGALAMQNSTLKNSPRDTSPEELPLYTAESTPHHAAPLNIQVPKLKQATPSLHSHDERPPSNPPEYRTDGFRPQTPKTPVCPCRSKQECPHRGVDGLVDLLEEQMRIVTRFDSVVDQDFEYVNDSIKKLFIVRSDPFQEEMATQIKEKERTLLELKKEVIELRMMEEENKGMQEAMNELKVDNKELQARVEELMKVRQLYDKLVSDFELLRGDLQEKNEYCTTFNEESLERTKEALEWQTLYWTEKEKLGRVQAEMKEVMRGNFLLKRKNRQLTEFIQVMRKDKEKNENEDIAAQLLKVGQTKDNVLAQRMDQFEDEIKDLDFSKFL